MRIFYKSFLALICIIYGAYSQAETMNAEVLVLVSKSVVDEHGRDLVTDRVMGSINYTNELLAKADNAYPEYDLDIVRSLKGVIVYDAPEIDILASENMIKAAFTINHAILDYESRKEFRTDYLTINNIPKLRKQFGVDNIVYIVPETDKKIAGVAAGQRVVAIGFEYIGYENPVLAHEFGHIDGIPHKWADEFQEQVGCGLMCAKLASYGLKYDKIFTPSGAEKLAQTKRNNRFIGNVFPSTQILANVNLEGGVIVSETDGLIEFYVSLIDEKGQEIALDEKVSVEIYTKNITTEFDFEPLIKRIDFDAGVSRLSVDLSLVDDDLVEDTEHFEVGVRFGDKVIAKKFLTIELQSEDINPFIPPLPTVTDSTNESMTSNGGTFSTFSLLMLLMLIKIRR